MAKITSSRSGRRARHDRIRRKVLGTGSRPRLCVFRSLRYVYAQVVDDEVGLTLVSVSSLNPEIRGQAGSKSQNAKLVGQMVGKKAKEKGIDQVVFDRGGFKYHGRVKALADGAREAGLKF
ncbi:MAG: 50S ribosomal protein L18 [Chloroflexi bacterium]|nr:50S ribosomal protein L18 [Chloroflexota bacterium]